MHSNSEAVLSPDLSFPLDTPSPRAAPHPATAGAGPDPRSWESLVRRYRRLLAGVAGYAAQRYRLRLRPEEIEDLLQDVWCRLVQHWGGRLDLDGGEGRVYAYLVRTTRNAVRDEVRARRTLKRRHDRSAGSETTWDEARRRVDPRPSPEERAMLRQWRRVFRHRCRRVAGRRAVAIVERVVLDGWSSRELAALLGPPLSPSAIDTVVHRVRRKLAAEGLELPRRTSVHRLRRGRRSSSG